MGRKGIANMKKYTYTVTDVGASTSFIHYEIQKKVRKVTVQNYSKQYEIS